MLSVLDITLPVFALVFCGYIAANRKMLPDRAVEGINAFVFRFALPAMLFRVVAQRPISEVIDWRYALGYLGTALAFYAVVYWLARHGRLGGVAAGSGHASALSLHITHGNVGYLGLPLAAEIGAAALPTAALIVIADIFVIVVLSMILLEVHNNRSTGRRVRSPWVPVISSLLRSPLVLSLLIGLAVSILDWPLPAMLDNFTRLLGGAAGPGALFAIGASLGAQRLKIDREIATLIAAKLVFYPAVMAASLFLLFRPDPYAAAIGVLCASLPGASNSYIIAQRYGVPTDSIAAATAAGTALSLVTISVVIWLLGLR
jgi:malonate transporter and related proteins